VKKREREERDRERGERERERERRGEGGRVNNKVRNMNVPNPSFQLFRLIRA